MRARVGRPSSVMRLAQKATSRISASPSWVGIEEASIPNRPSCVKRLNCSKARTIHSLSASKILSAIQLLNQSAPYTGRTLATGRRPKGLALGRRGRARRALEPAKQRDTELLEEAIRSKAGLAQPADLLVGSAGQVVAAA